MKSTLESFKDSVEKAMGRAGSWIVSCGPTIKERGEQAVEHLDTALLERQRNQLYAELGKCIADQSAQLSVLDIASSPYAQLLSRIHTLSDRIAERKDRKNT